MRYEQIKPLLDETILDEVKMSPGALQKFANSPEAEGMLMGIEFEMCVPNVATDDDSGEGEYDYDMDERAYDIDDIVQFFQNGEMSQLSPNGAQRLREKMWDEYLDWTSEKISDNLDEDELNDRIRNRLEDDLDFDDFMDQAAEELGIDPTDNDENESKVRERAYELQEEAIDEMMGNSREYERAYDDIRQEMEDDMRNDSDYDQEAWLRDIGIDYMSEAEREWSLDWPHWRSYGEGGELDVDTVGDEFAQAMGLDYVNTATSYAQATRDGKHWVVEPDGSINADEGDGGLEFVSPPMPIKDGLEMLQKMYAWAKKEGCYTNSSTGLHMNISVPDMTVEKLDYVKLALFLGDEYVLKKFEREYNKYCESALKIIKSRIRPEEVPSVLNQMKQHLNSLASKTIHSGITKKFTSINTKSNYVEFRGPGNNYLDKDPFELANTVLRLAMSLRIATTPDAYKQEYAKKLYKLVEQEKDPDNSVKLFSQYAVGELPKEDLVARLKFAKKERELEKTKKDVVSRMMDDPKVKQKIESLPLKWRMVFDGLHRQETDQLQSTANNVMNGVYDEELSEEQRNLVLGILNDELDSRKQQGEKKSYWVSKKDGSGGKQMVFAHNENEAILTGGKNMGMSREQSITQLRAEEKTEKLDLDTLSPDAYADMLRNLPTYTLEKFVHEIKTKERSSLETALRNVKARGMSGEVTPQNYEFLEAVIERELKRRDDEGEPGPLTAYGRRTVYPRSLADRIAALPDPYMKFVMNIPTKDTEQLRRTKLNTLDGLYDQALTSQQKDMLVTLLDDEMTYRASYGDEHAASGTELQFQPGTPMQVGTPEPATQGQPGEWPRPWNVWVQNIQTHDTANLRNVRATAADIDSTMNLSSHQRVQLVNMIDDEFRRRLAADIDTGERASSGQQELDFDSQAHEPEPQQNPAVAQQAELINRDDPVTSNDPEAQSPLEGDQDFKIVNPHTGSTVAVIRQATLDYAVTKARQWEQDLGLSAGDLQVQRVEQTSESINTLRRLAGLV